jgi:ABC-2 type transport system ATP-binding protein
MPNSVAVVVDQLSFSYGERKALDQISFEVGKGEIFGLLGPNGGGKTTLFRILSTLLPPESGTARIFGNDVTAAPLDVRRSIGVVFQNQSLDRRLSVEENLGYQGMLYGITGDALKRRIAVAVERTGVADRLKDKVEELSGGLRQRVELAKSLLHQPQLLLLDEPSTGVDPGVRLDFWRYLEAMRAEQGTTVLLTTHLLEEADKCDRLAILDRGHLIAVGTPAELKSRIGGDIVSLGSADLDGVAASVEQQLGVKPQVLDGQVRFEHEHGPEIVAQLMRSLPTSVDSVSVARPTLEDVFIRLTGHSFGDSQPPT